MLILSDMNPLECFIIEQIYFLHAPRHVTSVQGAGEIIGLLHFPGNTILAYYGSD